MANTYLSRTITNDSSNTKATISVWCKRTKSSSGTEHHLYAIQSGSNEVRLGFEGNDRLFFYHYTGSAVYNKTTTRKFRDFSSFFHIVVQFDSTQSTADDRIKIYINGVRETSFTTSVNPSSSANSFLFQGTTGYIGCSENTAGFFEGVLSHYHLTHGYSYDASSFGLTDTTTGEWKINTSPSVTYGTQGFFVLKNGNSGTDQSPNTNNWSVGGGTLTQTEDNPSNVFATLNPLARFSGNLNLTNANLSANENGNSWQMAIATLGASSGKYYFEYKITTLGSGNGYHKIGFISDENGYQNTGHLAEPALDGGYAFYCQNGNLEVRTDNAVVSGYEIGTLGVSFSNGDIMCLAVDMTNKKAYFRKNGDAWIKSANPATGTNGLDISADYPSGSQKALIPAIAIYYGGAGSVNFGNGFFGTAAISSEGTNASGNGKFEFDVPSGFSAWCTKGLNL